MNCANNIKIPAISVLMSVYKEPLEWLKCSLGSILNQSFSDFEFIIVLDGCTDNSIEICERYAKEDSRIIIVNLKMEHSQQYSLSLMNQQ